MYRVVLIVWFCVHQGTAVKYQIPELSIQALDPIGLRISMPEYLGTKRLVFTGAVSRGKELLGLDAGFVKRPLGDHWIYQYDNVELRIGDVIHYMVITILKGKTHVECNRSYNVTELVPPETPIPEPVATPNSISPAYCRPSDTEIRGADVCSGHIIFEDKFDSLREEEWNFEQYLPTWPVKSFRIIPSYPINVHRERQPWQLRRELAKFQGNLINFDEEGTLINGEKLDLTAGCTRPGSCMFVNQGPQVMPPIASGRITSRFSFKYGLIEVRAKLPQGDWLYPDILLESVFNKYGFDNYASGVLRIAGALGNIELTKGSEEYGNKILYGGPIMNYKCRNNLLSRKVSTTGWGNSFHNYSLRWAPDRITVSVDGEEWGRVEPAASGLHSRLPKETCDPPRVLLTTPMAPFDEFFHITLGISAGGISEFPDHTTTQDWKPKPWKNGATKDRVTFIKDVTSWLGTWKQPVLLIDYVRVRAL